MILEQSHCITQWRRRRLLASCGGAFPAAGRLVNCFTDHLIYFSHCDAGMKARWMQAREFRFGEGEFAYYLAKNGLETAGIVGSSYFSPCETRADAIFCPRKGSHRRA
jgi:hypothetical protein